MYSVLKFLTHAGKPAAFRGGSSLWVQLCAILLLAPVLPLQGMGAAWAGFGIKSKPETRTNKPLHPVQNFLPPVATINPGKPLPTATASPDDPETVTLTVASGGSNTVKKPELHLTQPDKPLPGSVSILQTKGMSPAETGASAVHQLQQTLEEQELQTLWQAAVERNPVIRFSLEKLAIPKDLQARHSSQFMNKTLNVLISGATMAAVMVPGGGAYRNMGSMAGGDALRNVLTNKGQSATSTPPLTPTELIQLASLVDELKGNLIHTYHDYRNNLLAYAEAHREALRQNEVYTKALQSGNSLAHLASATAYYRATMVETDLKQRAKLNRVQLERLSGTLVVDHLQLALAPEVSALVNNKPAAKPALKEIAPHEAARNAPEATLETVHAEPVLPKYVAKKAPKLPDPLTPKKQVMLGLQKGNDLIGPTNPYLPNLENAPSSTDSSGDPGITPSADEERQLTPASALEGRSLPAKTGKISLPRLSNRPQPASVARVAQKTGKTVVQAAVVSSKPTDKAVLIGPPAPAAAPRAMAQLGPSEPLKPFVGPPVPSMNFYGVNPPTVAELMGKTPVKGRAKAARSTAKVTRALISEPAGRVPLPPGPPPSSQTAAETLILN